MGEASRLTRPTCSDINRPQNAIKIHDVRRRVLSKFPRLAEVATNKYVVLSISILDERPQSLHFLYFS